MWEGGVIIRPHSVASQVKHEFQETRPQPRECFNVSSSTGVDTSTVYFDTFRMIPAFSNCAPTLAACYCDKLCHHSRFYDCCMKGNCWPPQHLDSCNWQPQVKERFPVCKLPGPTNTTALSDSTIDPRGFSGGNATNGTITAGLLLDADEDAADSTNTTSTADWFSPLPCVVAPGPANLSLPREDIDVVLGGIAGYDRCNAYQFSLSGRGKDEFCLRDLEEICGPDKHFIYGNGTRTRR